MDFFELVKTRRSIRMYKSDPVEKEKIEQILEAARLAPSAGNCQPYEFRLVEDNKTKQELTEAAFGQGFVKAAPFVLIFIENSSLSETRYGMRGNTLYVHQDTAIAVTHAHLAAHALGLGSCWVGAFDSPAVARILDLDRGLVPVAMLPIGYPAENPSASPRRRMSDLLPK
jgi:nitroreductase